MKPLLLIALFGALYFLGLGSAGLVDYDEALYAEISRSMDAKGELIVPELNGELLFDKPPLLYWAQVAGFRLVGTGALGARLFNALAAVACTLALYGFARRPFGKTDAFLAALVLGTSLQFIGYARIALTDMILTLWLVLTLGCLHRALECHRHGSRIGLPWFLGACLGAGLAMLTKGAIGFLLPAGAAFFYLLWTKQLRFLLKFAWIVPGLLVLFAVGLSWYVLLGLSQPEGFGFLDEFFWKRHVGRFTEPMEGHSGPFYYYLPVLIVGLFPWSPFLIHALRRGHFPPRTEEAGRLLGLFAMFGAETLLFFSISATKLPNYVTPVLPTLALLLAWTIGHADEHPERRSGPWHWSRRGTLVLCALLGAFLLAAPTIIARLPDLIGEDARKEPGLSEPVDFGPGLYIAALAAFLAAAGPLLLGHRPRRMALSLGSCAAVFYLAMVVLVFPRYDDHFQRPLRQLSRQAAAITPEDQRVVLLGLRHRPTVIFYGGRQTEYCSRRPEAVRYLIQRRENRIGITTRYYYDRLLKERPEAEIVAQDTGFVLFRLSVSG